MKIDRLSLKECLVNIPQWVTQGIPQGMRHYILVATLDDIIAGISYIQHSCPDACCLCVSLITETPQSGPQYIKLTKTDGSECALSVVRLSELCEYPEAHVVVFSSKYFASCSFGEGYSIIKQLSGYVKSCSLVAPLSKEAWYHRNMPDFYLSNRSSLEKVYTRLQDVESKEAFASIIKTICSANLGYISLSPYRQYAHPAAQVRPGDYIIDGGISASWNVSLMFAESAGSDGRLYCFEPEPTMYTALQEKKDELVGRDNIFLYPLGLYSHKANLHIVDHGAGSWVQQHKVGNSNTCAVTDLDSFVDEYRVPRVDIIKLDIEGSELACLQGAQQVLKRFKPRLHISAYHKLSDLYTIPEFIDSLDLGYSWYFACHQPFVGEFVYYAVAE